MIQFTIRLLRSATGTTHYVAQTHSLGTLTLEALTDHLLERNPIGGRAAIQAVLTTFFAVCQDRLLEGYNLTTPLFNTRLAVKGEFDGLDDGFLPGRNYAQFHGSAGTALARALGTVRVEKVESVARTANISQVIDVTTGTISATLTPGGLARLTGKRLKLGTAPDEGVFLVQPDASAVQVEYLAVNRPSEVVFQVPFAGLEAGQQVHLEVRNRLPDAAELRVVRLPQALTVA